VRLCIERAEAMAELDLGEEGRFWPSDDAANGPIQAWVRQVRRDLFVYGASRPPEPGWPTLAKVGYAPSLDDALSKASDFVEGL